MRKALWLGTLSAICMLFVTIAVFAYWDYVDTQRIGQIGQTEHAVKIQVTGSSSSTEEVSTALEAISEAYSVSIFRNDAMSSVSETVISGAFDWDTFPTAQLVLLSGALPTGGDEFLASYETGESSQVGTLYTFAGRATLRVQSIDSYLSDSSTVDGIYYVVSESAFDSDSVLEALSTVFGLSEESLLTIKTMSSISVGGAVTLCAGICVLGLLAYFSLVSSLPASCAKDIGIRKLMGWSKVNIWQQISRPTLIFQVSALLIADSLILVSFSPLASDFLVALLVVQVGLMLVTQVLSVASLAIINGIPASSTVKDGVSLRVPLCASTVVKIAIAAGMIVVVSLMSDGFDQTYQQWKNATPWLDNGDCYVFSSSSLTEQEEASIAAGDTVYVDKFAPLYELLNEEYGGLYVSATEYETWTLMDVNPNYVSDYKLSDAEGDELQISEEETRRVVLVPSTMSESEVNEAIEKVESNLDALYSAETVRWGDSGKSWDGEIEVMVYEGNREFFSYSKNVASDSGFMVSDPVFLVVTEGNISNMERADLANTGLNFVMKLPIGEAQAEELKDWLEANGFAEDDIQLGTISSAYESEMQSMLNSVTLTAAIMTFILIFSAATSYLLASLLVLARGRVYAVESFLGWGWASRHRGELLFVGAAGAVAFAVMRLTDSGAIAVAVGMGAIAVDAAILLLVIRLFEARRTVALVKGA